MALAALRLLTRDEENLLRWILQHGSGEARSYLPQVEGMRARPSCTCGCPSIFLSVSERASFVGGSRERVVADFSGQTPENISVGILLFQDNGKLSELEIYPYDNAGAFTLPTIESLAPIEARTPNE